MADRYLLESGAPDGYLLEDGTGVLLLEVPPVVEFLVGTADTGLTPNTSGAFVPTSGDLLVVFACVSATTDTAPTLTSSVGSFTFSLVTSRSYASGVHMVYAFVSDALVSDTSSQTVAIDTPADEGTGSIIFVYRVAGVSRVGTSAVRQFGSQSSGAASVPEVIFSGVCLTGNPTLGVCANQTDPGGLTPPTNWTEPTGGDLGYASPTIGCAVCSRDSGFTGTTITWAANSATVHGEICVEIDMSAAAAASVAGYRSLLGVGV